MPAPLQARVGAGTRIGRLAELLHGVGQALPNMGDIDKQSFGGALGTATHGSGATLGAYHTQLQAIQIVDGRGNIREFDKATNPRRHRRDGASLGAFGAVDRSHDRQHGELSPAASPMDDADRRHACRVREHR